jgi:hypothetical protein
MCRETDTAASCCSKLLAQPAKGQETGLGTARPQKMRKVDFNSDVTLAGRPLLARLHLQVKTPLEGQTVCFFVSNVKNAYNNQ